MRRTALAAVVLFAACPSRPVAPPLVDAGSTESADAGACPQTPCVAGAECVRGTCYSRECGREVCVEGELCFGSRCVSAACAGVQCAFGSCVDGGCPACSAAYYPAADGGCEKKGDLGASCSASDGCVLGHCVEGTCCETPCDGQCERCATGRCTSRAQYDPGALGRECFPGRCPGGSSSCTLNCFTDTQCADGGVCVSGACELKRDVGARCGRRSECTNGLCIDGFCCNTGCGQPCAQCVLDDAGTTNGICTASVRHKQAGCAPYQCDGVMLDCPTTCADDTDCNAGFFCDGQQHCEVRHAPGASCSRDAECLDGRCNSGFCCSASCLDGCSNCLGDAGCQRLSGLAADAGATCPAGRDFCWQGQCCDTACTSECAQCNSGTCGVQGQGERCGSTVGPVCNGLSASCPTMCQFDSDCIACEYYCSAGQCVVDPCYSCSLMSKCCNPVTHACGSTGVCVACGL